MILALSLSLLHPYYTTYWHVHTRYLRYSQARCAQCLNTRLCDTLAVLALQYYSTLQRNQLPKSAIFLDLPNPTLLTTPRRAYRQFRVSLAPLVYDSHCTPDSIWLIVYPGSKQLMLRITVLYK